MIDQREITPELLTRLSVVLYTQASAQDVLEDRIRPDRITSDQMAAWMMEDEYFRKSYSMLECRSYAQSVIDYVTSQYAWKRGNCSSNASDSLDVMELFLITLQDLLLVSNETVLCSYEQIFSWRLLASYLGEELAVSAKYAVWDFEHGQSERKKLNWPYVVSHNNKQLNTILYAGIADHHNHLWGSTPYFQVSWINLMNQVTNETYNIRMRNISSERTNGNIPAELVWDLLHLCAAWIRLYLCERLIGTGDCAALNAVRNPNALHTDNWTSLLLCRDKLQNALNVYRYKPQNRCDYALNLFDQSGASFSSGMEILMGERWLYYNIFLDRQKISSQRCLTRYDYTLFYAYCLMCFQFRSKMVQNNGLIGFDNFQRIQRKKGFFADDEVSEKYLVQLAVNETLKNKKIKELELRITPNVKQFERLTRYIAEGENGTKSKDACRYVFHFIKQSDDRLSSNAFMNTRCRHNRLRKRLQRQADQLIHFREEQAEMAQKIVGIDAASQEIGCRPEVFAPVYRMLGNHTASYRDQYFHVCQISTLGKTYHVGEDFLDIVDGLRAIDETIRFLDFSCGDRLGHTIALGINVSDWYEKKHCSVTLPVQDYLDNLAWFYHALNHFHISGMDALKNRIIGDFEYWFRVVYRNAMSDEELKNIIHRAREDCYDKTHEDRGIYCGHTFHFDIMDYYRAWTLRGDDPSCYAEGYFRKPTTVSFLIPSESCKVNEKFPPHYEDRYVAEYSILNYYYQYDASVRREGSRRIKVNISQEYIQGVKAIQIEMRYLLAQKGISIECNPTSNALISTFRNYEDHPILALYNRGLPVSPKQEAECAQLHVSINTDDSGVFYTNLETEYALMARSIEQISNENGRPLYKKADIYIWLDHIRQMGLDQSFRHED